MLFPNSGWTMPECRFGVLRRIWAVIGHLSMKGITGIHQIREWQFFKRNRKRSKYSQPDTARHKSPVRIFGEERKKEIIQWFNKFWAACWLFTELRGEGINHLLSIKFCNKHFFFFLQLSVVFSHGKFMNRRKEIYMILLAQWHNFNIFFYNLVAASKCWNIPERGRKLKGWQVCAIE